MQVFFLSLIAPLGSPIVAFFYGTWASWTRIPCKNFYLFFILNFTYSYVSWRPIVAFLMELELHELEFHANIYIYIYIYYYYFKLDHPILDFYKSSFTLKLDFEKIELHKRGISLISLRNGAKRWFFCMKRALAHFLREISTPSPFTWILEVIWEWTFASLYTFLGLQ